jgi:hypothetical protein
MNYFDLLIVAEPEVPSLNEDEWGWAEASSPPVGAEAPTRPSVPESPHDHRR